MKRRLARFAVGAWIGMGVLIALLAPEGEPPGPKLAESLYGETRSLRSSAPGGVMALARTLAALGYDVVPSQSAGVPDAEVLFLLGPQVILTDLEVQTMVEWVLGGGRLVYGPSYLSITMREAVAAPEAEDGADSAQEIPADDASAAAPPETIILGDPLVDTLKTKVGITSRQVGAATMYDVGQGRVAVLPDAAVVLSNSSLQRQGLAGELVWLRPMLAGASRLAFDEARIGMVTSDGAFDLLMRSRFAAALRLAMLALFAWLVASGFRREPAQPLPPLGARAFKDHLDAVADVLLRSFRHQLAGRALREGTKRRLGPLAATPRAQEVLHAVRGKDGATGDIVRTATLLRQLERELHLAPMGPSSARRAP